MNKTIYLTGYEKETVDEFIEKLKKHGVTVLVDVRQYPLSRKYGFSKNILQEYLEKVGIQYQHVSELGSPKLMRDELRQEGDYITFFCKYRAYIKHKHFEVQKIVDLTQVETICVMCFEKDCELCHRTILADEIQKIVPNVIILAI